MNPLRMEIAYSAQQKGAQRPNRSGFNNYAAGDKRYGFAQSRGPNTGMALDRSGYAERDQRAQARRNMLLKRLQARQGDNYFSADAQRPIGF